VNNITTIIFAHGDAIETINRHLPIWKAYTDNLLIVSPKDNPCIIEGIDCLSIEKRQHHGPHTLARHLFAMKAALGYNSDYYVFLEYDAIMLKRPEPRPIIQGNLFNEKIFINKEESGMKGGHCFLHFPWIFPADKLKDFVEKVDLSVENNPVDHKNYAHDIWIIQKLMKYGFDVYNLLGYSQRSSNEPIEGYSNNSFDTPERTANAVHYVEQGAYALHGIKTEEVLKQILEAANQTHFLQ
jgi:hypothetical protein